MSARPCATCGSSKNASVHSRYHPAHHAYSDSSKVGLQPMSEGRRAFRKDIGYTERSQVAMTLLCAFWIAEAVSVREGVVLCDGRSEGVHHIAPRGAFGGLKAAEQYPKVPACNHHNGWCQQTVEGQQWAKTHFFVLDGWIWPFLLSPSDLSEWPKDASLAANRHIPAIVLEEVAA